MYTDLDWSISNVEDLIVIHHILYILSQRSVEMNTIISTISNFDYW